MTAAPTYSLLRPAPRPAEPVVLDDDQRRVVEHRGGPLLVLAGPGTGKTTTLVEVVADRIERREPDTDQVLALTFSRKAAEQLRERVAGRLGGGGPIALSGGVASTFHSFAYALIRRYSPPELYDAPLRLLSAPEQDVVLQQILTRAPETVVWPESVSGGLGTRGFAREVAQVLARAQEKGLGYEALRELGEREGVPELAAAAAFMAQYDVVMASDNLLDYPSLIATAVRLLQDPDHPARDELRAQYRHVVVDEYQDTDPAQVALLRALAGDGRDLLVVGDPHQSIYAFRGAEVRGILEFPDRFRRVDGAPAATCWCSAPPDGSALGAAARPSRSRPGCRCPVRCRLTLARFLSPSLLARSRARGAPHFDTERARGRAPRRPAAPCPPARRRRLVRHGRAGAVGAGDDPRPGGGPLLAAGCLWTWRPTTRPWCGSPPCSPSSTRSVRWSRPGSRTRAARPIPRRRPRPGAAHLAAGRSRRRRRARARAGLRAQRRARPASGAAPPRAARRSCCARRCSSPVCSLGWATTPAEAKAAALATLLARAREQLATGATVEELLWGLWSGTDGPSDFGGPSAAAASPRGSPPDLDAVVALFDAAARAEEQRGHLGRGVPRDPAGQQIPADTLAERGCATTPSGC
ncbi:MAG: UvrD-helicase domain-containing protein [Nocardioides sp.]